MTQVEFLSYQEINDMIHNQLVKAGMIVTKTKVHKIIERDLDKRLKDLQDQIDLMNKRLTLILDDIRILMKIRRENGNTKR